MPRTSQSASARRAPSTIQASPEKRALLVAAAEALFRAHGIRRVSIEEICRKAGVSKVTFYKLFEDKTAIAIELLRRWSAEKAVYIDEILEGKLAFEEKLARIEEYNDRMNQAFGSALIEDLTGGQLPEIASEMERLRGEYLDRQTRFIREGQKAGELNREFPIELYFFIFGQIHSMVESPELARMFPDPFERIRMLTKFLYHGIRSPRRSSR